MLWIIIGHIVGLIISLLFFKDTKLIPTEFAGTAPVYLGLLGLFLFVEYQLYRSLKYGTIYFRGSIDQADSFHFKICQLAYAIEGSCFIIVLLQNIF